MKKKLFIICVILGTFTFSLFGDDSAPAPTAQDTPTIAPDVTDTIKTDTVTDIAKEKTAETAEAVKTPETDKTDEPKKNGNNLQNVVDNEVQNFEGTAEEKKLIKMLESGGQYYELKEKEKWVLSQIFGDTLKIDQIKFLYNSLGSRQVTKTIKNTIHFNRNSNVGDANYRMSIEFYLLFLHESTHTWQYQHIGAKYITDSVSNQLGALLSNKNRGAAYKYSLDENQAFTVYNTEQQAKIIEDYFGAKIFRYQPQTCLNYQQLKFNKYIETVEKVIIRDINPNFKPLNRFAVLQKLNEKE